MKRRVALASACFALAACGPAKHAAHGVSLDSDASAPPNEPAPPKAGRDAGAQVADAAANAAALGDLAVVDEPDMPCEPHGGVSTHLYSGDAGGPGASPVLEQLERVGARFAAGDRDGFVLFDADGANPSAAKTSLGDYETVFASEGATLGVVGSSYDSVHYRRFDPHGNAIGPALTLSNGVAYPPRLSAGAGDGGLLAVWGDGRVFAAGVTPQSTVAGAPFALSGTYTNLLSTAVVADGGEFAVVWSVQATPAIRETWFVRATAAGVAGAATRIVTSAGTHRIVKITATSGGYAAAIDGSGETYVLLLDGGGNPVAPAHRMQGARFAWDLVARGGELGLLANRADGVLLFRPLDASAKPLGPWVCVDSGDTDDAALAADGAGYAAVARTLPSYDDELVRFDRLGTGR